MFFRGPGPSDPARGGPLNEISILFGPGGAFKFGKFRSLRRIETVMAIEHALKEFCRLLVAKKRAGICVTAVTAGVTVASPTLLVNVRAKSLTLTYCC